MTRFDPQPDEPTRPNRFAMSTADPPPIQTKITNLHCWPTPKPMKLPLKDHKNQHQPTLKPNNTDPHRNPLTPIHTKTHQNCLPTPPHHRKDHEREKKGTWELKRGLRVERMRESETVMRRKAEKKDSRRERVWVSLDLKRTEMVSFAIFWTFLLLVQTSVCLVKFTQNKIIIINI